MKKRKGVLPWGGIQHFKRGETAHLDYCIHPQIVFSLLLTKQRYYFQYVEYQVSRIVSLNVKIKDVGE